MRVVEGQVLQSGYCLKTNRFSKLKSWKWFSFTSSSPPARSLTINWRTVFLFCPWYELWLLEGVRWKHQILLVPLKSDWSGLGRTMQFWDICLKANAYFLSLRQFSLEWDFFFLLEEMSDQDVLFSSSCCYKLLVCLQLLFLWPRFPAELMELV